MEENEVDAWREFPAMIVQSMPKMFMANINEADGTIWLFVRYPAQALAIDFSAEAAEALGKGLLALAAHSRAITQQAATLEVIEQSLIGPDGRKL